MIANLLLFLAVLILIVLALPMLLGTLLIGGSKVVEFLRNGDRCACGAVDFAHDPLVVEWQRHDTSHRREMCQPLRESL